MIFLWMRLKRNGKEKDIFGIFLDFFKKIVIRMDISHNYYDNDGIFHCNLIDFLLERVELF